MCSVPYHSIFVSGLRISSQTCKLVLPDNCLGRVQIGRASGKHGVSAAQSSVCVLLAGARCCSAALSLWGIPCEGTAALCWETESAIASLLLDFH